MKFNEISESKILFFIKKTFSEYTTELMHLIQLVFLEFVCLHTADFPLPPNEKKKQATIQQSKNQPTKQTNEKNKSNQNNKQPLKTNKQTPRNNTAI